MSLKVKSYRESRQEPTEATEYQGLDQANDIEQLPAFNVDAVAGKENRDGAVDGHAQGEHQEPSPISGYTGPEGC